MGIQIFDGADHRSELGGPGAGFGQGAGMVLVGEVVGIGKVLHRPTISFQRLTIISVKGIEGVP